MGTAVRWILGLLAGIVVLATLLVVATLWRVRPVPHELADGQDLRQVLAGRWDWSHRSRPCADSTHAISFSEDRKLMRITQPWLDPTTSAPHVTEYDIVGEAPSVITGAIRGETRMTEQGVPVVWDLVLIGPNAYTWRQTDWAFWNSTATIVRCDEAGAPRGP